VNIEINGHILEAHCPTTGSIGGWILDGLPALVSGPHEGARRTKYTLEAVGVRHLDGGFEWIGVNQSDANRYVEAALRSGMLDELSPPADGCERDMAREKKLGTARIDFRMNNAYIEVKTPLKIIEIPTQTAVKPTKSAPVAMTDRLVKHIRELSGALQKGERAVLLTCFVYGAPRFSPPKSDSYSEIQDALAEARANGLVSWQVNFAIDEKGVELMKSHSLNL
jgi:sugar fermentation stimulation protein A